MIIYDLCCEQEHRFEGWFRSSDDFSRQQEARLLSCPVCASPRIEKIPSGGHIVRSGRCATAAETATTSAASAPLVPTPAASQPTPEQLLRQLVSAVIQHTEDVGKNFADEARKIHNDEAPARAIRGQATADEYEALQDEGIDVLRLPVIGDDVTH